MMNHAMITSRLFYVIANGQLQIQVIDPDVKQGTDAPGKLSTFIILFVQYVLESDLINTLHLYYIGQKDF